MPRCSIYSTRDGSTGIVYAKATASSSGTGWTPQNIALQEGFGFDIDNSSPAQPLLRFSRNDLSALTVSANTINVDYLSGDYFTVTLTEDVTDVVVSNLQGVDKGATLSLLATQDGTGGWTLTPPASWVVVPDSDTFPTSIGDRALVTLVTFDNGITFFATVKAIPA